MGDVGIDILGALLEQRVGGIYQGAAGIHDIVDQDAGATIDFADHVHDLGITCPLTPLVDDGEGRIDPFSEATGPHHATYVGRHHHDGGEVEALADVAYHDRGGIKIIGRNIEKALNLPGMEVK